MQIGMIYPNSSGLARLAELNKTPVLQEEIVQEARQQATPAPLPDIARIVKKELARSAKKSTLSREQIVDALNTLSYQNGFALTKGKASGLTLCVLEKILNPNAIDHIPSLRFLHLFCLVTGDTRPLQAIAAIFQEDIQPIADRRFTVLGKAVAHFLDESRQAFCEGE